ncbi:DUF4339 domain-containing protein [Bradyrhizobium ottawaense]|uniref:DUF4339 domain-containing protein n=1 Tax=Bradyrhizobium ottawaense TaxID=931866 RepID=UPI0003FD5C58|nr:DUF4339 domain-containing protein [Bradyrhizobium ottawaense]
MTTAWWLSDGTGKVGPLSLSELAETVSTYPLERIDDVLVWREGFSEWRPVNEVTELSAHALHDFKGANQGAYSTDHNANCCIDTANLDERHLMRRPAVSTKTIPLAVAATVAALVLVAWVWWPPAETNGSISVANHGGGTGLTLLANGLLEKQARRDAQLRGPWPDAYDRRGYKLGMTITEFKQFPYPEKRPQLDASVRCSGEFVRTAFGLSPFFRRFARWEDLGVIECGLFSLSSSGSDMYRSSLALGPDRFADTAFYFFSFEPRREPVLFFIEARGSQEHFAAIVDAFKERLGLPTKTKIRAVQNGFGNTFSDVEATYENSSSTIVLRPYDESIEQYSVTYSLNPVFRLVAQSLETKFGKASDKL